MTTATAPKLSARARKALDVLAAGGFFRKALETSFRGGEQFVVRLHPAGSGGWRSQAVRGFGFQTLHELQAAGLVSRRDCFVGSTFAQEWQLAEQA